MSVQELNRVHRRYIKVSNAFKSAWTFHQFIQGLRKVFIEDGPQDYPADFQSVYNDLKQVSKILTEATVDEAERQLDGVEEGLAPLIEYLLAADEQVAPGLLRQFFQRVKNYDDNILSQLVKFYLYFRGEDGWNKDRLDKADYLSTKVCEEYVDSSEQYGLRDRTHVREMAQGFWAALGGEELAEEDVAELNAKLEELRREISAVTSIDELHEHQLVQRYRALKHQLGDRFFHPRILQAIAETNLVVKNHVHQLYRRDEQRIVAEYQQVFDLERETPVDFQLRGELTEFRNVVERFEKQLQGEGNVRLEDLAALRERVRELLPRLLPDTGMDPGPMPPPPEVREFLDEQEMAEPRPELSPADAYAEPQYRAIVAALDDTNSTLETRKVVMQPEVFGLGVEAREVLAYRRVFSREPCDRYREESILRTAALRARIESDVEVIRGILDDTAVTRDSPVYRESQETLRHADAALRRLEHLVDQAVLDRADTAEVRALLRLKVKLMRAYSGLWLLVYKD